MKEKKKGGKFGWQSGPRQRKNKKIWLAFIICQFLSLHVGNQVAMVSK